MSVWSVFGGLIGQVFANPIVIGGLMLAAGGIVAAWLVAAVWAFRDTALRTDSLLARYLAATWILASSPALVPLSVLIYMLVRPHESAGDRRLDRALDAVRVHAASVPRCPACAMSLVESWVRCPSCATWVARRCLRCERWAPFDASICPWCAWIPDEAEERTASRPAERKVSARVPVASVAGQAPATSGGVALTAGVGTAGTAAAAAATVAAIADAAIPDVLPAVHPRSA